MITFSMLLTSFRVLKMIVNHYLIFSNPVVRFFHLHGNWYVIIFEIANWKVQISIISHVLWKIGWRQGKKIK